jgi:hypothetical protein
MRITPGMAQDLIEVLDEVKEECFAKESKTYPFALWEQKRERVKQRLRDLPHYVDRAAQSIDFMKPRAGRHKRLDVAKRTMLFLFARLLNKSNRDVEELPRALRTLLRFPGQLQIHRTALLRGTSAKQGSPPISEDSAVWYDRDEKTVGKRRYSQ